VFAPPPKSRLDIIFIAFPLSVSAIPAAPATFFVPNSISCCLSRAYHFDTSTTLQVVTLIELRYLLERAKLLMFLNISNWIMDLETAATGYNSVDGAARACFSSEFSKR
jgi:hypothetical protein